MIREFWPEVSQDELQWNWHIDYLAEELMELAKGVARHSPKKHDLVINIPPGTTKSITCSIIFPVWCWINWPWMRFIVSSYSGALSLEHAEYSRDLVRSDRFQRLFPELEIKPDKDTKSNFRLVSKTVDKYGRVVREPKGNRYSTSVGGTLTGFHGHILIVDDPLDPNRAVSEVELASANRWLDQTLSTRKVDKAVTPTILIMQRLHQDDPAGHILSKNKRGIKHICLPGESRNYSHAVRPAELLAYYRDDLLDPGRMNWEVMKELEADLGQYGYAGQVGQEPTPPGGGMFKVDHFQTITVSPPGENIVQTVRYWDKAGTAGGGAYTVGVRMSRLRSGAFLVSDVKRGQWASEERERIIQETARADGVDVVIYHEQEPGSGGKDSARATTLNLAGYVAHADRPTGDKVHRADPYSVQVNDGNVMLLSGPWNHDFIEEHRFFPFSTHKDQVDAASGAFAKLMARKRARAIGRSRRKERGLYGTRTR
jgi:predicted phage terminase large subunit-like protein